MALIVEDGTGRSDAESYASVAEADTYHTNRGNAAWTALNTTAKEQALRKATDYMVQTYRERWRGRRVKQTQTLDWPRVGVVLDEAQMPYPGVYGFFQVDYTIVPPEVKNACSELALRASTGTLLDDIAPEVAAETVGPISVTYQPGAKQTTTYPAVDRIVNPFLVVKSGGMRVQRA